MGERTCSLDGCGRPHYGHDFCRVHYRRMKSHGSTELRVRVDPGCEVSGCTEKHYSVGYCQLHYNRQWRTGSTELRALVVRSCICARCDVRFDRDSDKLGGTPPVYCPECKLDVVRATKRESADRHAGPLIATYTCAYCDRDFVPPQLDRRYRTTCADCVKRRRVESSRLYVQRNPIIAARIKGIAQRLRRARKQGADADSIDLRAVCERDNWVCHICGNAIDPECRYPDYLSASLDHLIPLVVDPIHKIWNVAASHWICNVRRGANELSQPTK